jgi:hypothetical protein
MYVGRALNKNREIAPQAVYCDLKFTRCIAVGKETKRNAHVDDAL